MNDAAAAPDAAAEDRLTRQFAFLTEADRLKQVLRASRLTDGSRRENSGEHSWHLALYALVLADQAGDGVEIDRVLRMLILHDLVEIDAGDLPIHAAPDPAQAARELAAADRIFGLLPPDLGRDLRAIWDEFEAGQSASARFARALDRTQPVMQNLANGGGSWLDYDVTFDQLEDRVGSRITRGAPGIWAWVGARARIWFGAQVSDA